MENITLLSKLIETVLPSLKKEIHLIFDFSKSFDENGYYSAKYPNMELDFGKTRVFF